MFRFGEGHVPRMTPLGGGPPAMTGLSRSDSSGLSPVRFVARSRPVAGIRFDPLGEERSGSLFQTAGFRRVRSGFDTSSATFDSAFRSSPPGAGELPGNRRSLGQDRNDLGEGGSP